MCALAQLRKSHMQEAEAREEIVQQFAGRYEVRQRFVRGEDEPDIHRDITFCSKRSYRAAIEHVEQLTLDGQRGLRELVAEERATARRLERSRKPELGARERAWFMSEERGARKRVVQTAEIDHLERSVGTRGVIVYETRQGGLSCSGGTEQDHRMLGGRKSSQLEQGFGERPGARSTDHSGRTGGRRHRMSIG